MTDIIKLDKVDSTNNYAFKNYDSIPGRTLILAKEQTHGKGRQGKQWISPAGQNLYASYLMKAISFPSSKASWIGGLATLNVLRTIPNLKCLWIKWPNDIYCHKKKISGILCESITINPGNTSVVIGIGININMPKKDLDKINVPATSVLNETQKKYDIEELASSLLNELNSTYDKVMMHGIDYLYPIWKKGNILIGKEIELSTQKNILYTAKVLDINLDGALIVIDNNGNTHKVFSSDFSIKNMEI